MRDLIRSHSGWLASLAVAVVAVLAVGTASAETHHVELTDDDFTPKYLTIAPGDTVVWTNTTGSAHTVVADDESFSSTASGAAFIPFGETFTHTFTEIGLNPYYCLLHGSPGGIDMAGTIRVADPSANNPPVKPVATSPTAGAQNQSLAPTLVASAFSDPDAGDAHLASQWIIREEPGGDTVDTGEITNFKTSLPMADLKNGTNYFWKVRYKDDRGAWSDYSNEVSFTTVAGQSTSGAGLSATYAKYTLKTNLATVLATTVDLTVDFDWKKAKPHPKLPTDNFLVRWEGTILPQYSEQYRFRVKADGGVRLWVNGDLIIDDWVTGTFAIFRNGTVELEAGVAATIKMEYYDTIGAASVNLRWSSPSQQLTVIPQARLFPLPQ